MVTQDVYKGMRRTSIKGCAGHVKKGVEYLTQLLPFELFSKKFCLNISELGLEIV